MKNAEKAGNRFTPVSLGHRNALAGRKVRTNSSYLSDSTLLWNENQAYVFESFETVACSNGPTKRSLGHPLVEARCDFVDSIKKKTPKRPHLRVNLVLHKCFRTSHRQGCSPHSPLREKLKRLFPTLMFSPLPFNHKRGSAGVGSTLFAWFVDTPKRRTLCEVRFPVFWNTTHPNFDSSSQNCFESSPRARSSGDETAQQSL